MDTRPDLDPTTWFPSPPGTDGVLIERQCLRAWLELVADHFDHVRIQQFSTSTEGRPLDAVFFGDMLGREQFENLESRRRNEAAGLLAGANDEHATPPIVLITSGIHATEAGGPQSIPELVWWLVSSDEAAPVRERLLTIVVPTLNPDGFDMVTRWHVDTRGTDAAGSLPPLLYHRFAGHDNNRDWLFRSLAETRVVLDQIHAVWLPHVTLDQHQMHQHGPRFALPPYADPWEPHIHPAIIAGSNALGQTVASDMTLARLPGVVTGRYFDAWEPSRALQHYRGGIRILAEAASAALAHPIDVTPAQLASDPLPEPLERTGNCPDPWVGGKWTLRDIVDYHLAAAKSLLSRMASEPERWPAIQHAALAAPTGVDSILFTIPEFRGAIDRAANRRLADVLTRTGATPDRAGSPRFCADQPMGPLLNALLLPKPYPDAHGGSAYDVTTHHLPLMMGATIRPCANGAGADALDSPADLSRRYLLIDARAHAAPNAIEPALGLDAPAAWRASTRSVSDGHLVEPGTWIVDRQRHPRPDEAAALAHDSTDVVPVGSTKAHRRDVILLNIGGEQPEDHGWARLWLHDRSIPYLEADALNAPPLDAIASSTILLIADTSRVSVPHPAVDRVAQLVAAGATAIAFGASGRLLAETLSRGVSCPDLGRNGSFNAPGALLRLHLQPDTELGTGLDRWVPAMFQRDGVFAVSRSATEVDVLARFAARDTLVSGWVSSVAPLRNAPAVLRVRHGEGVLYAFSFRPLFRGQMLVTAPLVHNLLYRSEETATCQRRDHEKKPVASTSDRTSCSSPTIPRS